MAKDVSNKTVVILIILLLIVSLAGFWIISKKIDSIKVFVMPDKDAKKDVEPTNEGTIRLTIAEEPEPSVDETTGMISLTII